MFFVQQGTLISLCNSNKVIVSLNLDLWAFIKMAGGLLELDFSSPLNQNHIVLIGRDIHCMYTILILLNALGALCFRNGVCDLGP